MPHYRVAGEIPGKRHIRFRRPDGGLYSEELMGEEGFVSDSSLLYHVHPPTAIVKTKPTLPSADSQAWSKRASGTELRAAVMVPDRRRTAGRRVLVYDDVCTTGTQLDAIAACLLDEGGAARVEGVVLARAPWRGGTYQ